MRPIDIAMESVKRKLSELTNIVAEISINLVNKNWEPEYYRLKAEEALKLKDEIKKMTIEVIARFQPTASDLNNLMLFYETSYGLYRFSRYALDVARSISIVSPQGCSLENSWRAIQSAITLVKLSIRILSAYPTIEPTSLADTLSYAESLERDIDEILAVSLRKASTASDPCLTSDLLSVVFLERIADHSIYIMRSMLLNY
ncbi:MAG: hypothetical protein QW780_02560 [Sulfolobales archaeon]